MFLPEYLSFKRQHYRVFFRVLLQTTHIILLNQLKIFEINNLIKLILPRRNGQTADAWIQIAQLGQAMHSSLLKDKSVKDAKDKMQLNTDHCVLAMIFKARIDLTRT